MVVLMKDVCSGGDGDWIVSSSVSVVLVHATAAAAVATRDV